MLLLLLLVVVVVDGVIGRELRTDIYPPRRYAEMDKQKKNLISHRFRSLTKLQVGVQRCGFLGVGALVLIHDEMTGCAT